MRGSFFVSLFGTSGGTTTPIDLSLWNDSGVLALTSNIGWPITDTGLPAGSTWNNGSTITVVPGVTPNPGVPPMLLGSVSSSVLLSAGGGDLPLFDPNNINQLWNNSGIICISSP